MVHMWKVVIVLLVCCADTDVLIWNGIMKHSQLHRTVLSCSYVLPSSVILMTVLMLLQCSDGASIPGCCEDL